MYGPKNASGEDTYVLCEINISSVYPLPDEALMPLAEETLGGCALVRGEFAEPCGPTSEAPS